MSVLEWLRDNSKPTGPGSEGALCQKVCRPTCAQDTDCKLGELCEPSSNTCERLACTLENPERQLQEDPIAQKGRLTTRCGNGVDPKSPACEPLPCPGRTYCAPKSILHAEGYCEAPIPVVLSPVLIELFNSAGATSLGIQKIDGLGAMLGVNFQLHFGDSYFAADLPAHQQATKRAEISVFSQKAAEFSVTITARIRLGKGSSLNDVLRQLLPAVKVRGVHEEIPRMHDIFIRVVSETKPETVTAGMTE